jgi:hypothetical protein
MIGTEGRARLLREAQSAARLNHPNIVSVYDAGESEGNSYIIMELLEGESLAELKNLPLSELVRILIQVCSALEHAHQHGIIHRDLKPENVIITPQGTAKLTDFGLARSLATRLTSEGALVGTVFYMAPEQAMSGQIDARTDLYALGAMIYELCTGRLPFTGNDPLAVVSQHLYAPVIPPGSYNPAMPAALEDLIMRLMCKRQADRPASAGEVHSILETVAAQLAIGAPTTVHHAPLERLGLTYLIGREEELGQAKGLWLTASVGTSDDRVLLISGEPGVGKTPFTREIKAFAEITGGKVLNGECYAEGGTPYAPAAEIIRAGLDALGTPPPSGRKNFALPAPIMADLVALAPDLRLFYPDLQPNPSLEPQAEQARLFESVVALCTHLSAAQPLLVAIENVQWADGGSLFLLRHLARRARAARLRLLIVLTYREAELDESALLNNFLLDLQREHLAQRIKLTRYDRQGTQQVLEALLQDQVTPALVDAVYRETEGNLFFIDELVKSLVENGQLVCLDCLWQSSDPDALQIPQSVRATIQSRVTKLPDSAQDILRLAAIIGREFDFATLLKASDGDGTP